MGEDRLKAMFVAMPTLKFLLMGHPNMQAKPVKKAPDGMQVLEIPVELQVSKTSFLLLVGCLFGADKLPPRGTADSRLTELTETMLTLGGCTTLEEKLKHHSNNPMTPEEDTDERYTWTRIENLVDREREDMLAKGFSFTTTRDYFSYFRAPQGTRQVRPRAAPEPFDFDADFEALEQQLQQTLQALARSNQNNQN